MTPPRRAPLVALGALAFLVLGAIVVWRVASGGPATSSTSPASVAGSAALVQGVHPAGAPFASLTAGTVQVGDRTLSVVVADSEVERVQGLRGRSDAAPFDGMLFVFPSTTNVAFTMAGVPDPLDIGFYGPDGAPVDRLRMQPCSGTDATCPVYRASASFRYALETAPGALPAGSLGTS